jgi:hypothetical protein
MIEFKSGGGLLGNKMFQVAISLVLAKRFKRGVDFSALLKDWRDQILPLFNIPERNNDNIGLYQSHRYIRDDNINQLFELEPEEMTDVEIRMRNQHFLQTDLAAKKIRENLDDIFISTPKEQDGIFIHYRLGDLGAAPRSVHPEYIRRAIESIPDSSGPRYISSDSPNHELVNSICGDYGFNIYENSPVETILFGSKFTNKILSLGTFSWWIGVLGSQNNVIYPDREEYVKWCGDIFVFEDWTKMSSGK